MASKNPIIIAQIMGKMNGGGVESVIMNYYRNIDRSKYQFDFICDADSTNIPYSEIEKLGGNVILCPPYQHLRQYINFLKKLFNDKQYQIVHSNINTLSIFPLYAAQKCNIPIRIAHSHSTSNPKELKRFIIKRILRKASKKYSTHYFACSKKAGEFQFGKKAVRKNLVTILPNAIDMEKFAYNPQKRSALRAYYNIAPDALVIGHVGRFCKTKNHQFLIKVFKDIHKKNSNSILMLIGQGPLETKMQNEAEKMGLASSVRFIGQKSDISTIYSCFDVFCLPSLYEGLPVVGVEAQANGLPCVLSNNMTKESKILESTIFLGKDKNEWEETIIRMHKTRSDKEEIKLAFEKKGMNIKDAKNLLEQKYIECINIAKTKGNIL